ncbi:phenylalanine--tRNA ligase subunit beta [Acidomonas methanolica]|uniref:phenylalanine--tRNA ligase subunit beta n=1 Tax=Acidomonas methanolica TaxID=437 RepID=UPI00211A6D36|nr:phenylalanine--tRNA ligase subunit beta [Acidomonas methanolica]MCQ9155507.1 phenylalanine--tRNA ligase subunit beta [Acidomonas methanolica]
MKFTLSWLRDHLDFTASLDEILAKLNGIGLEVESVHNPADSLKGFRVAKILEAHRHPDADRLQVCVVAAGGGFEKVQVVCGAPNARAGLHVIFAPPGTHIPGSDITIKAGKIRGQESNGMLCSYRELALGEEADGIAELAENVVLGQAFAEYAKLDDPVIEISITPNRGDALSVRGIARDLAAAGIGRLRPWLVETVEGTFPSPVSWRIDYPEACPYVAGRLVRGVRNGPSPDWLRRRLEAIGLKPISALVDVTNYLTYDLGRPLHVFDAAKIAGGTLTLARAAGESFTALDGRDHVLGTDDLVIVDQAGVQSLAGIMGGAATGVSEETTDVFLEAALFDPVRIALTGRRLGIHSDARQRFERGVDPALVLPGLEAATRLILDLCGGVASEIVQAGEPPAWQRDAWLRFGRIAGLGGVEIAPDDAVRTLEHLGFEVLDREETRARFAVPSWRNDIAMTVTLDQAPHLDPERAETAAAEVHAIEAECDLIEEVLRLHGVDAVPPVMLPRAAMVPVATVAPGQARNGLVRRLCAARGLMETVGFSFVAHEDAALFGVATDGLRLLNPIASDLDQLRPSPLPNLVRAWQRNVARGLEGAGLFEIGPSFSPTGQTLILAGLRGGLTPRFPGVSAREATLWDAKADLEAALAALGVPGEAVSVTADAAGHYHPGRSGQVRQGPKIVLGAFGELHPAVLREMGADGPLVAFELFLDAVALPKNRRRAALVLSPFQPVRRDFAFLAGPEVEVGAVLRAARAAERGLIGEARLFDVYEGAPLEPGFRSLGVEVVLHPAHASLTDAEIEAVCAKVVAAVEKATGARLRR